MSNVSTGLSPEELQNLLRAVIEEMKKPNAVEAKRLREQEEQEERRAKMVVELGKIEEARMRAKKYGCSHCRHPMSSGKIAGMAAPRGQGEWTTGGQLTGSHLATMVCIRCGWVWQWEPTPDERQFIVDGGLLGAAPPPEERCVYQG